MLQNEQFWCGWCQDWASVRVERVDDLVVEESSGTEARLVRCPPPEVLHQPLRVPAGWQIDWNTFFEEDPTTPENSSGYYFGGADLFLATSARRRLAVDLEWRTSVQNPAAGHYLLRILRMAESPEGLQADWHNVIHQFESNSRADVVRVLEEWLTGEPGRRD